MWDDKNLTWVSCASKGVTFVIDDNGTIFTVEHAIIGSGSNYLVTESLETRETDIIQTKIPNLANYGGECQCPNGTIYKASAYDGEIDDSGNCYSTLACIGGTPGNCSRPLATDYSVINYFLTFFLFSIKAFY